jgi:hypothetical protein
MAKAKPKKVADKPTSGHSNKETVSFGWCDNGMVEGRFATAIIATMTESQKAGINVVNHLRVNGNQDSAKHYLMHGKTWAQTGCFGLTQILLLHRKYLK